MVSNLTALSLGPLTRKWRRRQGGLRRFSRKAGGTHGLRPGTAPERGQAFRRGDPGRLELPGVPHPRHGQSIGGHHRLGLAAEEALVRITGCGFAKSRVRRAWNPLEGFHLATASGDDGNPVVRLWDLRSSTTMPLGTLRGHTQGILSIDWCPDDTALLASCARDNKTLLWDLSTQQAVYELPGGGAEPGSPQATNFGAASGSGASDLFGGSAPGNGGFGQGCSRKKVPSGMESVPTRRPGDLRLR